MSEIGILFSPAPSVSLSTRLKSWLSKLTCHPGSKALPLFINLFWNHGNISTRVATCCPPHPQPSPSDYTVRRPLGITKLFTLSLLFPRTRHVTATLGGNVRHCSGGGNSKQVLWIQVFERLGGEDVEQEGELQSVDNATRK